MKRAWSLCFVAGLAVALAVGVTAASAAPKRVDVVIKHAPEAVEKGTLPLASTTLPARAGGFQTLGRAATTASTAEVGDQKFFLGLDDVAGRYFVTTFTLRAIGEHIEIWVQDNLNFPTGDCRNDGVRKS